MLVDSHAHLFHPKWYPKAFCESTVRECARRSERVGRVGMSATTAYLITRMLSDDSGSVTVKLMDKVGIDRKVILILDLGLELGEAPLSIEEIHKDVLGICRKFSDRLIGFAGVDPRRPQAIGIVRQAFDELGAKGLKLHPTGGWRLSDECTHKIVELAEERGLPVLVHIGRTIDNLKDANAQPQALIELARWFPQVQFIAGHSGFELFEDFVNAQQLPGNLRFDISGWQIFANEDEEGCLRNLQKLIQTFPGRVCYGSDSPFYTYNLVSSEKGWLGLVRRALAGIPSPVRGLTDGVLGGQNVFTPSI